MPSPTLPHTRLLISDLDHTLLGDDDATFRFAGFIEARRQEWCVVYNSSRFMSSIRESVRGTALPEPDLIIGGMGTQIEPVRILEHDPAIAQGLGAWTRRIDQPGWGDRVRQIVAHADRVQVQPDVHQSDLKASFYLHDASPDELAAIERRLLDAGIQPELIYSSHRDLDVLPKNVHKASATVFVAEALGFQAQQVVVCGDSGNDRAMLTAGFNAVIVANARPELHDLRGPRIYRASRAFADGVIEGLMHWSLPSPATTPA